MGSMLKVPGVRERKGVWENPQRVANLQLVELCPLGVLRHHAVYLQPGLTLNA